MAKKEKVDMRLAAFGVGLNRRAKAVRLPRPFPEPPGVPADRA